MRERSKHFIVEVKRRRKIKAPAEKQAWFVRALYHLKKPELSVAKS